MRRQSMERESPNNTSDYFLPPPRTEVTTLRFFLPATVERLFYIVFQIETTGSWRLSTAFFFAFTSVMSESLIYTQQPLIMFLCSFFLCFSVPPPSFVTSTHYLAESDTERRRPISPLPVYPSPNCPDHNSVRDGQTGVLKQLRWF